MDKFEKFITLDSGLRIFARYKEAGHKRWLIVTHGIAEHCGRYNFIFDELSHKYNIMTYDLRGHGRSAGKKADVSHFELFKKDLNDILWYLNKNFTMDEYILFGHSMGGLIVSDFIQSCKLLDHSYVNQHRGPNCVFLSSPPVNPGGWIGKVVQNVPDFILGRLADLKYGLYLSDLFDKSELSHNEDIAMDYSKDPLVHKKLSTSLLLQLINAARRVFSEPLKASCPLYCVVGSADQIVDSQSLLDYSKNVEPEMNLLVIEGGRHELHNEIERYFLSYQRFLHNSL